MIDEPVGLSEYLKARYVDGVFEGTVFELDKRPYRKVSPQTVRAVRDRLAKGQTVKYIALDMDIGLSVVYRIKNGITFRSIK